MLTGRKALITGSTSGIGWGIAQALSKAGALIYMHGLEAEQDIQPQIDTIETIQKGHSPGYVKLDISTEANCELLIKKATKWLGHVDILVNNVGMQKPCATQYYPLGDWEKMIHMNLTIPFILSKAVIPQMYERKWGRLIHMGSANSLVGSEEKSAYVAAKHGLHGMSKVIALEAAGTGVTSNTICPGFVLTPFTQKQIDDYSELRKTNNTFTSAQFLEESHPTKQFVTIDQVGGLAAFLCSEFAEQCTGAAFSMDGGWTTH